MAFERSIMLRPTFSKHSYLELWDRSVLFPLLEGLVATIRPI